MFWEFNLNSENVLYLGTAVVVFKKTSQYMLPDAACPTAEGVFGITLIIRR
jgi:hypothetical protein